MKKLSLPTNLDYRHLLNVLVVTIVVICFALLLVYIFEANRPVQTADIKVPIATDKASYYPGQVASGIFFGETYYTGKVKILREIFCSGYKGLIEPPEGVASNGYYETQSRPRKLEGTVVTIGTIPADAPIGSNCVIQFINVYTFDTFFGSREVTYPYYTQNFAIITKERRLLLDCEAQGREDCGDGSVLQSIDDVQMPQPNNTYIYQTPSQQNPSRSPQPSVSTAPSQSPTPTPSMEPTNEPEVTERPCVIGLLGLCILAGR